MCWADYTPAVHEPDELTALTDAVRRVSASLDVDALAARGALEVRRATGVAFAAVAVMGPGGTRSIGHDGVLHADRSRTGRVLGELAARAAAELRPVEIALRDAAALPRSCRCCMLRAVPAIHQGALAAVVVVGGPHGSVGERTAAWVVEYARSLAPLVIAARDADRRVRRTARAERYRLATELHDTLGQLLYTITLTARQARCQDPAELRSTVDALAGQASDAAAYLREIVPTIAGTDAEVVFASVLEDEVAAFMQRTGIGCEVINLAASAGNTLHADACMLRALREGLHNVEKHARASSVVITLRSDDERLELIIQDDGDPGSADAEPPRARLGFGLRSLRRDLAPVGGGLRLDRNEDAGVTLRVWVPART